MTAMSSAEESGAVAASPGAAAIEKAAKADKYLFVFFFDGEDSHTGAMKRVFEAAMAKMTDRADSIAVSVTDPAEKRLVNKFSVCGAPMPLVLAIAPTGAPTGNLDPETSQQIIGLLEEFHAEGKTIVMVTHDPRAAKRAKRTLRLQNGAITCRGADEEAGWQPDSAVA